jgi:hypothetical protein
VIRVDVRPVDPRALLDATEKPGGRRDRGTVIQLAEDLSEAVAWSLDYRCPCGASAQVGDRVLVRHRIGCRRPDGPPLTRGHSR